MFSTEVKLQISNDEIQRNGQALETLMDRQKGMEVAERENELGNRLLYTCSFSVKRLSLHLK